MKILFYSSYWYPYISGLTQSPYRVLTELSKDHQITCLTFPHQRSLPPKEKVGHMQVVRIPYWFRLSKGYISPQSLRYFFQEVKKADVVFLNLPNVEALPLAVIAKLFGKRIISLYNCKVDLGPSISLKIVSLILNFFVFLQLYLSDTIISYPDYMEYLWEGKVFKKKIQIVMPVIKKYDTDKKALKKYTSQKENTIWIGFAGRLAREKGIEYLIEAIEHLDAKKPVRLVFVGPSPTEVAGESGYADNIQNQLKVRGISHIFLGKLSDQELAAFYKTTDILILPSVNHTEAFGMVQAEAMLQGTPVIATNMPGVRIPISRTQMGILVPKANPDKLREAIKTVLENRNKFNNTKLIRGADQIFDTEEVYEFYRTLFV